MSTNGWETLDVEELLSRREEAAGGGMSGAAVGLGGSGATTSVNAGPFAAPLGTPLRRKFPSSASGGYSKIAHPYLPSHESNDGGDLDYEWAKKMTR